FWDKNADISVLVLLLLIGIVGLFWEYPTIMILITVSIAIGRKQKTVLVDAVTSSNFDSN
ncbi:MAG: hypothetical protein BRC56_00300, partial [Cyanobacteria bacterium SW_9_47_5]